MFVGSGGMWETMYFLLNFAMNLKLLLSQLIKHKQTPWLLSTIRNSPQTWIPRGAFSLHIDLTPSRSQRGLDQFSRSHLLRMGWTWKSGFCLGAKDCDGNFHRCRKPDCHHCDKGLLQTPTWKRIKNSYQYFSTATTCIINSRSSPIGRKKVSSPLLHFDICFLEFLYVHLFFFFMVSISCQNA